MLSRHCFPSKRTRIQHSIFSFLCSVLLFLHLPFFFWPLHCLSFFDLRFPIIPFSHRRSQHGITIPFNFRFTQLFKKKSPLFHLFFLYLTCSCPYSYNLTCVDPLYIYRSTIIIHTKSVFPCPNRLCFQYLPDGWLLCITINPLFNASFNKYFSYIVVVSFIDGRNPIMNSNLPL